MKLRIASLGIPFKTTMKANFEAAATAVVASFLLLSPSLATSAPTHDYLARTKINVPGSNPEAALDRTIDDLRPVFQRYKPAIDSTTKITKPLRVSGTAGQAVLQVSARKCVVVICKEVDLRATVSMRPVSGQCLRNFLMTVDLSGSTKELTDVYDRLDISVCFNNPRDATATLQLEGYAHRAGTYQQGTIQREILNYIKMQINPITSALNEELASNSR